ncbi:cold-shock DNA-binding protein family [Filimonas lacunae]|uniref:Cold-shock DNA-binding protein family n=1 Tax=Filimonas lacunae TaxID=477680 RepID=A0A173MDD0_9BACT|nr:cold shock domain-containing protein [Filimonas lacunae]BAV05527.1 cold shock protein CspG [Filimonas lacunae]SIT20551.1 cold-shock DNA-binding protein family [Filimonas lacunae]
MAKSQDTFTKRERERQRLKKQMDKKDKMLERKTNKEKGKSLEDMLAYVDENGNLADKPADPRKKQVFRKEDMMIAIPKMEDIPVDLLRTGTITFFNYDKGFGFITDHVSQESIFVHTSELTFNARENDKVQFNIGKGPKGPVATNVEAFKP